MSRYTPQRMASTHLAILAAAAVLLGVFYEPAYADGNLTPDAVSSKTTTPEDQQPAATGGAQLWIPMLLAAQYNGTRQRLQPFTARYSGPLSLTPDGDTATSQVFGAYFGMKMTPALQAYLDIEQFIGTGVGNATGLGSPSNGDVVRGGSGLPQEAYIARAYLEYLAPLSGPTSTVDRGQDQLPGVVPVSAVLLKIGKLAATDDFDQNRYANSTRTQFESWTLINNGAWDYAADTRGYTDGLVIGYLEPDWSLKFGFYRMPRHANQEALDWPITRANGDNLELDLMPNSFGTVIRLLAYRNVADMGIYQNAIDLALATGTVPDVAADDAEGRTKYGYGINLEQPLADNGDTGVFLRAGWNNGKTETFAFTEVDRNLSFGTQISGVHWGRREDCLGVGVSIDGLSPEHRRYLELGGSGFELGDGALNYGLEQVFETYYRIQVGKYLALSPDYQFYRNPGYNRDRGPVHIYGLRVHLQY